MRRWAYIGSFSVMLALETICLAGAGQNEAQEESGKKEKGERILEEELDTLEDADFPELVGVDDQGEIMDELEFLREESFVELAARRRQPIAQSASAITLLTREEIESSGARSLPEALRVVPNMDIVAASPLWYDVGIRGGGSAIGTDVVLLLVDGRDATIEFLGFPTWTAQHFSLDEVKRIEVIRGPGSALYGANAFSGVVSVTTYDPDDGPRAMASARAGEHGQLELGLRGRSATGPLAWAATAGMVREDMWTERATPGRELTRGRLDGRLELGSAGDLSIQAGAYHMSGEGRASMGEIRFEDMVNLFGLARYQREQLRLQAAYERYDFDAHIRMDLKLGDTTVLRLPPFGVVVNKVALTSQHGFAAAYNRFTYGAEYLFHHYYADIFLSPNMTEHRAGVFVQDEVDIDELLKELLGLGLPSLVLTAGVRADWNTVSKWELSPRATMVCQPAESLSLRVGFAHAFLKPKLLEANFKIRMEDLVGVGIDRIMYQPDDDLGNETIDSLEAGIRGSFFGDRLQVGLDFAYNWYRHPIEMTIDKEKATYITIGDLRIPDPSREGLVVRNSPGGVDGYGLELQLLARPADILRLFIAAGHRRLSNTQTGNPVVLEPDARFAAGLDLGRPSQAIASLRAFYTSAHTSRALNPGGMLMDKFYVRLPETWLLNARVSFRLAGKPFEADAGLEIFDLLGTRFREQAGLEMQNRSDWAGERLDRRVVLFLSGRI